MIVDAGYQALPIALVVAVYVAAASFIGAYRGLPALALSARYGLYTLPLLLGVSTAALVYAFVTDDFSVRYVAENSNLAMPDRYTWVALYAGNSGSLLFIAVTFSAVAAVAAAGLSRKLSFTAPFATGLMAVVLAFFIGVMVLMANPLDRLPFTPEDGRGINPLLIHFGMFIHPPVQMFGLASVAVPFSIAMGALLAGRGGRDEWVDQGRLWGVLSWLVLTTGLLLGSWWAYTILGWGGYWAWDPVENSALMPWLAMTAFVHSIMVQKRRGMFRMWNIVLVAIAFTLAEMGMFINRGGPVPSVHSFAQSTMGWTFLAFMTITLLGSLAAFAWRIDTLRSRERLESTLSRESAFLTQNVLLLVVAFVTLWGTVYPVIAEAFLGETVTVGEPFFNRVNGPILLVIVLLMGVGPLLPWRRASARTALRLLRYPLGAAVVVAAALAVAGVRQPVALLALAVVALGVTGILHELLRGTLSRHRRGESLSRRAGPADVRQPAPVRGLRRAPRHSNARGGGDRLLVLPHPARLLHEAGRRAHPRGLHVPVRRRREHRPRRPGRGSRPVHGEKGRRPARLHEHPPIVLSRTPDVRQPGRHPEHADRGFLYRAVGVRG